MNARQKWLEASGEASRSAQRCGFQRRVATIGQCLVSVLLFTAAAAVAQPSDPDSARVVTDDIKRFWKAYDSIEPGATKQDSLRAFFEHYYLPASPGLLDFIRTRIGSVYELVDQISSHPEYYASIREPTLQVVDYEKKIMQAYHALDSLYDDAVFPDTYIQIGRMNSGGTLTARRLLIGAEMYGKTPSMPVEELGDWHKAVLKPVDEIPHVVAHELVHYQQRFPTAQRTLLSEAIKEGSADLVAEIISGKHINGHIHEWADPREPELWKEFREKMNGTDFSGWLYNGDSAEDRPADLGYWMGYKIARAFYERSSDKEVAIRSIFRIDDFQAFLDRSGYARGFED